MDTDKENRIEKVTVIKITKYTQKIYIKIFKI
jgi:hypothetical protein